MTRPNLPKVKLISFADGAFTNRKAVFEKQAEAMRLFSAIEIHNRESLDPDYLRRHENFMVRNSKGFGFYIWKSQVVLQSIKESRDFDFLCWLDAGFTLNPNGKTRLIEYLEMAQDSAFKMLSFFNIYTEYTWTKADLAKRLGVHNNPGVMNSSQLSSGFFIIAPTKSNCKLIEDWANISIESNYHYSNNQPSEYPNHKEFIEHRHDQSIFSLLRKIRGTSSTFYEVQSYQGNFDRYKDQLPVWATRSKQ